MINDYKMGTSIRSMTKKYNHCRAYISKNLRQNGVNVRNNKLNSRKYFHNEDYFERIDCEEKAYWLGFIYADGYILSKRKYCSQQLGITLSYEDVDQLVKFKKYINATNPINKYKGSGYNEDGYFARILLTSQKTVDDLKKCGVMENKTFILKFPNLEERFIRHFVRGYIDGDGSISFYTDKYNHRNYQINILGTEQLLEKILDYFNIYTLSIYEEKGINYVHIGGNEQTKKILKHIYDDSNIYMQRKYDVYLDLCKYTER